MGAPAPGAPVLPTPLNDRYILLVPLIANDYETVP